MGRLTARNKQGMAYFPKCFEKPCMGYRCEKDRCELLEAVCEKLAYYEELEEQGERKSR